jgi:hypothetical protein
MYASTPAVEPAAYTFLPGCPELPTLEARLGAQTFITECAEELERVIASGHKAALYLGGEALASGELFIEQGRLASWG